MNQEEDATIYENEAAAAAAAAAGGSDFKSRVTSRLTGVRKTLSGMVKKKPSAADLDDTTLAVPAPTLTSAKSKISFKGPGSSSSSKADVEKAVAALGKAYRTGNTGTFAATSAGAGGGEEDANTTDENSNSASTPAPVGTADQLRVLASIKSSLRPFLFAQLQHFHLFHTAFVFLITEFPTRIAQIVLDLTSSGDDQLTIEVYREVRSSTDFYSKFLACAGQEDDALLALVNFAKCPSLRCDLLADMKDQWQVGVLRWLRSPTSPDQLQAALQLVLGLSTEEGNRVSLYSDLKPAEKSLMDLIVQHKTNGPGGEDTLRLSLLVFGNLAAHRYNATFLGQALKPTWTTLRDLVVANTSRDVVNAVLQLMWSLSSVRDSNEVFRYEDVKPLLSSLMDLCRNAKTPPATTQAVLGLWNNLAQTHDNRPLIQSDLKAMWPTFVSFITSTASAAKSSSAVGVVGPDALTLMTLSLLNNLAFSTDNQAEQYSILRPHWQALLTHVKTPRTRATQAMTVLLLRNLAVCNESKQSIQRDLQPVWPTLLDALRSAASAASSSEADDDMLYGVCHLLWNLSKLPQNRADLYQSLLPVLAVVVQLVQARGGKNKDNTYALVAMLKNLAQSPENRKMMALDLKPHLPALLGLFTATGSEEEATSEDVLELTVWLFQSLAKEPENQSLLYVELKPIQPKLCSLVRNEQSTQEMLDQILSLWASLAKGKSYGQWVFVDLDPVRSRLKELLANERSTSVDVLSALLLLYSNLATEERAAEWVYNDLQPLMPRLVQLAKSHDVSSAIRGFAIRLLSAFATNGLREDLLANQTEVVAVLEENRTDLDCILALGVLCGGNKERVSKWFGANEEEDVQLIISVLEDCTVTGEWGYQIDRPLQALSYLVGVSPSMRQRVKVAMLLDAIDASWKKRDMLALQYAYATIKHCVADENNEIRFQGNVFLMETARKLSQQDEPADTKREAAAFLAKFSDAAGQYS